MADSGPGIGRVGRRFGWIFAAIAVNLVEILGLRVVRLQIVIADRPRWGDPAVVAEFAEVFLAQAEKCRAIELGIAADVIVRVRMEVLAVFVEPGFLGVVVGVDVYNLGVPVCLLARNVVAPLEDQDSLSRWSQVIGERSAACAGSDNDYVVAIVTHDANPPLAPQKMQRLSLSWCSLQHFTATRPLRQR